MFLDEIDELGEDVHVLLPPVIQERTFLRVGDTAVQKLRAKIIAATHCNLDT